MQVLVLFQIRRSSFLSNTPTNSNYRKHESVKKYDLFRLFSDNCLPRIKLIILNKNLVLKRSKATKFLDIIRYRESLNSNTIKTQILLKHIETVENQNTIDGK